MPMPKSVIDMVDRIGKKEWDMTGLTFMNRNRQMIQGPLGKDEINANKNELMATDPHPGEMQEELPGIEMDNDEKISDELDQGKDLNHLAEKLAGNAEGGINDDVPTIKIDMKQEVRTV